MAVVVRPERPGDEEAIHAVHAASFPAEDEAKLVDALRAAGRLSLSLVAVVEGRVVGHVAFSPVTAAVGRNRDRHWRRSPCWRKYRRRGVAAELIRAGLEACRAAGVGWAVVLGSPAYYGRFGFRAATEFGLSDEYGGGPAFQAVELIAGTLPVSGGLVRYAPEFAPWT